MSRPDPYAQTSFEQAMAAEQARRPVPVPPPPARPPGMPGGATGSWAPGGATGSWPASPWEHTQSLLSLAIGPNWVSGDLPNPYSQDPQERFRAHQAMGAAAMGLFGMARLDPTVAKNSALGRVFNYFNQRYPRIMQQYVDRVGVMPLEKRLGPTGQEMVRPFAQTQPKMPGDELFERLEQLNLPKGGKSDIFFDPDVLERSERAGGPLDMSREESYVPLTADERLARMMGHEVIHATQVGRPDILYGAMTHRSALPIGIDPETGTTDIDRLVQSYHNEMEPPAYVGERSVLNNYLRDKGKPPVGATLASPPQSVTDTFLEQLGRLRDYLKAKGDPSADLNQVIRDPITGKLRFRRPGE